MSPDNVTLLLFLNLMALSVSAIINLILTFDNSKTLKTILNVVDYLVKRDWQ